MPSLPPTPTPAPLQEREAWSLPASVFKSRAKECESHAYYDGDSVLDKMFEKDWQRAVGKEKFSSFMARENKGCKANKMDKVALQVGGRGCLLVLSLYRCCECELKTRREFP